VIEVSRCSAIAVSFGGKRFVSESRCTNTKIRLINRVAFGFRSPDALIALAMLNLGGHRPILPGRK